MKLVKWAPVVGAVVLVLSGLGAGTASAGTSGTNGCAYLSAFNQAAHVQQICGASGTYHFDIWGTNYSRRSLGNHTYSGLTLNKYPAVPVADGGNVCIELWYHKPGGGYESRGLPCDSMN
ncbi:hypothetical protein JOD54_000522 [Actinokineospora baliensis]|uniref:hypothetical protein n=1 Tax=Actinokineospora baliensis TaxID=547056 RepID=UPI0019580F84|nr:hypothetical protein [Actinokineospora baliensis]MBM7770318.1 hypothetical protein [Actinokineospora baliensis]